MEKHIEEMIDLCYEYDDLIKLIRAKLEAESIFRNDFVLVDDGQDLGESAYELLKTASMHITVFMDGKQRSSGGADEIGVFSKLEQRQPSIRLLDIHGVPPHIAPVAAGFIEIEAERRYFLNNTIGVETGEREKPLLYLARDLDDEIEHLAEAARTRIDMGESVGILSTFLPNPYTYGLKKAGLDIDVCNENEAIDFRNGRPKAIEYRKANSLAFDSVLMPGVDYEAYPEIGALFLGVTRAEKWVYFSAIEIECLYLDRFLELERQGKLVIQRSDEETPEPVETIQPDEPEDLSDLF